MAFLSSHTFDFPSFDLLLHSIGEKTQMHGVIRLAVSDLGANDSMFVLKRLRVGVC